MFGRMAAMAVMVTAASVAPAAAQERAWSVGGTVGASRLWDDEGTLGPGPTFTGTVGRRLWERFTLEGMVLQAAHERATPFLSWEADGLAALGRGLLYLRGEAARTRPFLAGGLGVMRSSGTVIERDSRVPPGTVGSIVDRRDWRWTALAWDAAFGVDVRVGRGFIRGEAGLTSGEFDRGGQLGVPEPPLWTTRLTAGGGLRF